jgi:hypothetical protein
MALAFFAAKKEHSITETRVLDVRTFFVAMEEHPKTYTSGFNWHLPSWLQRKNILELTAARRYLRRSRHCGSGYGRMS